MGFVGLVIKKNFLQRIETTQRMISILDLRI